MTTFLSIAWVAKFLIIPIIGWGVASLFFSREPARYTVINESRWGKRLFP